MKLFAWGVNKYGQLGLADNAHIQCEPLDITHLFIEIKSIETEDVIFDEDEIIDISCGSNHTLVLTQSQQLWGIGHVEMGQLATSNQGCAYTSVPIPLKIKYPKNEEIKNIRSGSFCCCAVIGPKQEQVKKATWPKRKAK